MRDEELDLYLELLNNCGWKIEPRGDRSVSFNESFSRRHPRIPPSYTQFLQRVVSCSNQAENVWFLCSDDYNGTKAESAWAWNEFEKIDLDGARDEQTASEIVEFWDHHLPFMYSVAGDYAHLSFRLAGGSFGSVVEGYDIALTDVSDVASSFEAFVRMHIAVLTDQFQETVLRDFV
jgi:hypothetical protein